MKRFIFRFLVNEPDYCLKNNGKDKSQDDIDEIDILILVSSAISHSERREAIRDTWGSRDHLRKYNTKVLFLLGQGNDHQGEVLEESHRRRDIIQEDFHVRLLFFIDTQNISLCIIHLNRIPNDLYLF